MEGKSFDQVDVLIFNGEKYVIGNSLAKAAGIAADKANSWIHYQIVEQKLFCQKDYIHNGEEILFTTEAATRLFEKVNKLKKAKPSGRFSKRGYPLDEYGLPILPPPKKQALINPYKL
jgi:hypothetical protein